MVPLGLIAVLLFFSLPIFAYAIWQIVIALQERLVIQGTLGQASISDLTGIVGIHATILSLAVGSLSAYGLFLLGKVKDYESPIYAEVEKVNSIQPAPIIMPPGFDRFNLDSEDKREGLLRRLREVTSGAPVLSLDSDGNTLQRGLTPAERGQETLHIVSALFTQYPFKTEIVFNSDGSRGYGPGGGGLPRRLSSITEVKKWLYDLNRIFLSFDWVNRHPSYRENIAAAVSERPGFKSEEFIEGFSQTRAQAAIVSNAVREKLALYDEFRGRHENIKWWIVAALLVAGLTFISGVALPLANPQTPAVFTYWIPFSVYLVSFLFIVIAISRI